MALRNSSEVLPTGIDPISVIRLITAGECIALTASVLILASTSGGVWAATISPNQVLLSKPGRPASCSVGTSGKWESRLGPAIASTRSFPAISNGSVVDGDVNIESTSPVTSAMAAGSEPGYGTSTILG